MQSFHHSRGRILFEVLCALSISASCVGAWMQTNASALLAAASVSALYGLVHLFDMRGRKPAVAAERQQVATATDRETAVPGHQETLALSPPAELQLTAETNVQQVAKADPPAPKATRARKTKAAPKAGRRRASAREETKVVEVAPPEEANVTEFVPEEPKVVELIRPEEPKTAEPAPSEDAQAPTPPPPDETAPIPLTPLFDPKPFVRQQRAAFGRKA